MEPENITNDSCDHNNNLHGSKETPRIRYLVEYRDSEDDSLLWHEDTRTYKVEHETAEGSEEPIFELVTTIKVRTLRKEMVSHKPAMALTTIAPTYRLKIYSTALVNAIQSVVQYYPSQDLTGDILTVHWPYAVLVHHYDELETFGNGCAIKDKKDLCIRERDAKQHIAELLKFLDEHIMTEVRAEQERNKRGYESFAFQWVAYKPGKTGMSRVRGKSERIPGVVHSMIGGSFTDPPSNWEIKYWKLEYDGVWLGRRLHTTLEEKYDGEAPTTTHLMDCKYLDQEPTNELPEFVINQIEYGRKFWDLLNPKYQHCKGKAVDFPYTEVDSLVMADLKMFLEEDTGKMPGLMDQSDLRNWITNCRCSVCTQRKATCDQELSSLFHDYNWISREDESELTTHQYLVCDNHTSAFVFNTRKWVNLHVRDFTDPKFDEGMINNLVMLDSRKKLLKALSKSFARLDQHNEAVEESLWTADFVKGKGSGLIFLLHGRPGVGKTCTAECIAAFTKRPLMIVTPSDIGTTVKDVEKNLARKFKVARAWGAVLLIDEADIFMEKRTTADLERNALVAAFLRELENYDGILFLTTNRVGSFDDAFISRVHVQLYYPEFTDDQRQQVWKTFIDKLARERGRSTRLNLDAKEYIRGEEMRAMRWNGREIRNAFQTAVALAEYDAEKDEEGKILVTDTHFRSVLELSRDFKDYLKELHRGDEAKRAARGHERHDYYAPPTM